MLSILVSSTALQASGQSLHVPEGKKLILAIRIIVGFIGFTMMVSTVQILPLSFFSVIFNTAPFWAAIISWYMLGETVTCMLMLCMAGSFFGILILVSG